MSENFAIDGTLVDFKRRTLPGNPDTLVVRDEAGNDYKLECNANFKDNEIIFGYGDMTKKVMLGNKADIRVHTERSYSTSRLILRAINLH